MKKAFRIFTSVFLSLTILLVSGGFTLSKMTCLETGYKITAFSKQSECCKVVASPFSNIQSKCCDIFNQDLQVGHFFSSFNKTDLKQHPILLTTFSTNVLPVLTNSISTIDLSKIIHPPPIEGIDLLHYIHKLTV